jgi:hypothetical protein
MNTYKLFRFLLAISVLLQISSRFCAQPPVPKCDWTAFEDSAAELRAARDAAMQIPETNGNTEVPPEAIKQIQQFKNSLNSALESYFLCQPNVIPENQALERDLYARLAIPVPPPPDKQQAHDADGPGPWKGLYLSDVTVKVKTVPDARKLIAVLTSFEIPYGEDAVLDIFDQSDHGMWRPTVEFTSKPYNSIAGAFQAFNYKISPVDPKGNWFVVATHINPWPTSCWQGLFIDTVQPNELGMQSPMFHDEEYGYICDDVPPYLRSVSTDGFQIQFSINSIDESQLSSISLMNYKVDDEDVIRVQPVALNPVNFVDEWIRRTWRDAQGSSSPGNMAKLQNDHSKLHSQGMGDFTAYRSCVTHSVSEVQFTENNGDGPNRYFLVKKNADGFTMLSVSDHATASCKGTDRLSTIKDR